MRKTANERGYNYRWQKERLFFLAENPLCTFCKESGRVTAATVVDHIEPHKGDMGLFWDTENWQALCKTHHDSTKARMENGNDVRIIGVDGWPVN